MTTTKESNDRMGLVEWVMLGGAVAIVAIIVVSLVAGPLKPKQPDPLRQSNATAIRRINRELASSHQPFKALGQEACDLSKAMHVRGQVDPLLASRFDWLNFTYKALYADRSTPRSTPNSLTQMQKKLGCEGAG